MQEIVNALSGWASSLAGGDIVAIIIAAVAVSLFFSAFKTAIKTAACVIGTAAIVYLIDPSLFGTLSAKLNDFISNAQWEAWATLAFGH